jgi:L-threonylcarbamoyladenylate synthase
LETGTVTSFEYLPLTANKLLHFSDAARIVSLLDGGGLAVLPTETGYMIAADATSVEAVTKVFTTKERTFANPMHVACGSLAMAGRFGQLTPATVRLMGAFTPGPLTVVVPKTKLLPDTLVTKDGTVGIRVPDHPATLQVVELLGRPVTATSLNRSGEESGPLDYNYLELLGWPGTESVVAIVEDETSITQTRASTLATLHGADLQILREGPITKADIERVLRPRS